MGIFSRLFSRKPKESQKPAEQVTEPIKKAPPLKTTTHHVAGTSYRQDAIRDMGTETWEYSLSKRELVEELPCGGTVYEYEFYPNKAELVPEPDNPHDPKAIKVLIDGVHVGYIKAGSCARIHKLLRENRIKEIEPQIIGGRYKRLYAPDDGSEKVADYDLERGTTSFGVRLEITEYLPTNQ